MKKIATLFFIFLICCSSAANKEFSEVLLGLSIILIAAKIGGHLAAKFSQPEVLGELVAGVLLGNLVLVGFSGFEFLTQNQIISGLSEIGIILLLFEVGLETSVAEMMQVGLSSFLVATLGVIAPFFLGTWCSMLFAPGADSMVHYFVGATLTATSVGITARVLKDLNKVSSSEGKIILGAAVIDDVLGLLILAVVTAVIEAKSAGAVLNIANILQHTAVAVGFLFAAVLVGRFFVSAAFQFASKLKSKNLLLIVAASSCFLLSYVASLVGLAPIVGAFTAGLILEPAHYRGRGLSEQEQEINQVIAPLVGLLVPVFFVIMGARVEISVLADSSILIFAFCLSLAAILGKQICSLGVFTKGADKFAVGLGMIPRGEVGLIFAGIGATLKLNNQPLINSSTFAAVIIMVMVTTIVTPPLLKWRLDK